MPNRTIKLPKLCIDLRGASSQMIWRHVQSAYRTGYDEFKLLFDDMKEKSRFSSFSYNTLNSVYITGKNKQPVFSPIEIIQLIVNRCIGIEIVDQKEDWCVIKELGETSYKEFDGTLRRIFLLLISWAEEIQKTINTCTKRDVLRSVDLIDTNIDRFTDFCIRVLNKKGYKDFKKTPTMHTVLFLLELIGDEFKKISVHLMDAEKITPKMENLFNIQYRQLKSLYTVFYKFDKEECTKLLDVSSKGHHYDEELFNSLCTDEKEILHHFKKIAIYLSSLTQLRIDLEY